MNSKSFFLSPKVLPLGCILFGIIYALIFYFQHQSTSLAYQAANNAVPSIVMYGSETVLSIQNLSDAYGLYFGGAMAALYLIVLLIAWFIAAIFRITRLKSGMMWVMILGTLPLFLLGLDIVFFTTGYTAITNGIKFFIGIPLFYSSAAMIVLAFLFMFTGNKNRSLVVFLPVLASTSLLLSGCVWDQVLMDIPCSFAGNGSSHCYQQAAIQGGNADKCDKIKAPEQFIKAGSNPPKDKCLSIVAQNTNQPKVCNNIQGGIGSYTKEDCATNVATANKNPDACSIVPSNAVTCLNTAADMMVKDVHEKLQNPEALKTKEINEIQNELEKLQKYYDMMSTLNKGNIDNNMTIIKNLTK